MFSKFAIPRRPGFKPIMRFVCCFIPALLIELAYRCTLPYVDVIEGGERKLVLLLHAAALLSTLLLLYRPRLPRVLRYLSIAAAPGISFFLMEYITHFAPRDISIPIIILNLVLYYLLGLFLLFLFGRSWAAVTLVTVFPVAVGLISYYVLQFRGNPLLPWDISSFATAMGVVSNYTFLPTIRIDFVLAMAIFQVVLGIKCSETLLRGKPFLRLSLSAAFCALLAAACFYVRSDHCIRSFSLDNTSSNVSLVYTRNGFMVAFLVSTNYSEEPENYSLDMIDGFASQYPSDPVSTEEEERPNVIVIMNESYSDLRVLGDYETSEPLFPFIDSLEENTAKGWAHVSVLGGNTPNSEFEFLTGLTMGFLPQGVIAYSQYIGTPVPSLATQFNSLGYRTVGSHAFWGPSWNRDKLYPLLGFQEMYFKEAFPEDAETLRLWITDSEMYKLVEDIYEESEQPLFLFGITMMNHGGYHGQMNDEFDTCVTVDGLEDNGSVTEYISLMRETDRDFQELIEYFSNTDEKTVILLFGDHQPNDDVAAPIMELTGSSAASEDVSQSSRRYITPYVLWANYDVDFDLPEDLSLNYLAAELMKACGLELTGAQNYLLDLAEEYPVISSQCYWDAQGNVHPISDYTDEEALTEYACIQHNYLLDSRNRREEFWSLEE